MTTTAARLARQLYRDDKSRADEVPVATDGRKAYDGWLRASSDAGDTDTREALESVDRDAFAEAWAEAVEADDLLERVRIAAEADDFDTSALGTQRELDQLEYQLSIETDPAVRKRIEARIAAVRD